MNGRACASVTFALAIICGQGCGSTTSGNPNDTVSQGDDVLIDSDSNKETVGAESDSDSNSESVSETEPIDTDDEEPRNDSSGDTIVTDSDKSTDTQFEYPYIIGAGIHDTTGPPAEVMFAGYSDFNQKGRGILMRTRSRAFVIGDGERRVVLVSVDLPLLSSGVHYAVVQKLKETFGELYTEKNVVLSATHTHSVPGGFFKTFLLNIFAGLGFSQANFDAIVNGIYESIVKAHDNRAPGRIVYNFGEFSHEVGKRISRNRSPEAYERNREVEDYTVDGDYDDTNRTLAQLKFIRDDETEIGVYHWLPHHPNMSGSHLFLINGDVNGLASYRFERMMGADYGADAPFVAAFAYTNAADSTGNLHEDIDYFKDLYPEENLEVDERGNWIADGSHDYQRMTLRADAVMELAERLYVESGEEIEGPVDSRQIFVHMPHFAIDPDFVDDWEIYYEDVLGESKESCALCGGAAGVSFIAGSMEDGDSGMLSKEANPRGNMTDYSAFDWATLLDEPLPNIAAVLLDLMTNSEATHAEMDCQMEKTIAISLAQADKISPEGKAWNLNQPIQIVRIGQLGIIALPVEVSVMSGRRIKAELHKVMPELDHVMINSTSNGTAMYLTTREEYAVQHYEGGANFMGPYTLNAVRQMVSDLGRSFGTGALPGYAVPIEAVKESLLENPGIPTGEVIADGKFLTQGWGEVRDDVEESYAVSEDPLNPAVVSVSFVGAHPNNDLQHQGTYLEVIRLEGSVDAPKRTVVARDWDPETRFIWERSGIDRSIITIEWHVPPGTSPGRYQIAYYGHRKEFLGGNIEPISGHSRVFELK